MQFQKEFWKSKNFWTGVAGIITSIGLVATGEQGIDKFVIEIIPGILGLLSIVFRWKSDQPLGFSRTKKPY